MQESTHSIFSEKKIPIFTQRSWLLEAVREIKALPNWLGQTMVSQGISEIERIWMVTSASTVSVPQTDTQYLEQLHALQQWYIFRDDRIKILHFLEIYPFLVPLLIEAYYKIEKYFPYSLVFLAITTDPEEFGINQLVAFIATDLGPDQASDALSNFDKKWWLSALKRAKGKLCITFGVSMSFDWSQYLDVARELAEQAKTTPYPLQEAKLRASISRAYYAAFGKARNHLRYDNRIKEPNPLVDSNGEHINIHQYVKQTYMSRGEEDYVEIGLFLDRMIKNRNMADYDLNYAAVQNLSFTTQVTLKWARDALSILKRIQKR